jgi:glycerol uptake facilitator-like aquaporin
MFSRDKIAMIVAEFLGAFVLTLVFYSIIARTTFPLFTGLAAGGVLAMLVLVVGKVSGAHANPALTLGLWVVRKIKTGPAIVYIVAQMAGGLVAGLLLKYFLGHSLTTMADKFDWKIFVAEATGAAVFTFGVVAALYQKLESGKLAAAVGVSFLVGVVVASLAANGVVNPAVAAGIKSWNWAYATGPLAGGVVGAGVYALLFAGDTKVLSFSIPTVSVQKPAKKSSRKR